MCNCSGGKKDHTNEAAFDFADSKGMRLLDSNSDAKGIGIFVVPAPEIGILETKAVYVESLTYVETVKRGANCSAFQWVPYGIALKLQSGKDISISSTKDLDAIVLSCSSNRCKPSGCPMGCFCYSTDTGNCRTS